MDTTIKIVLNNGTQGSDDAAIRVKGISLAEVSGDDVWYMLREDLVSGRYLSAQGWKEQAYWLKPDSVKADIKGIKITLGPDLVKCVKPGTPLRFGLSFDRRTFVAADCLEWPEKLAGSGIFSIEPTRKVVATAAVLTVVIMAGAGISLFFNDTTTSTDANDKQSTVDHDEQGLIAGDMPTGSPAEEANGIGQNTGEAKADETEAVDESVTKDMPQQVEQIASLTDTDSSSASRNVTNDNASLEDNTEIASTSQSNGDVMPQQTGTENIENEEAMADTGTADHSQANATQDSGYSETGDVASGEQLEPAATKEASINSEGSDGQDNKPDNNTVTPSSQNPAQEQCETTAKSVINSDLGQEDAFDTAKHLQQSGCAGEAFLIFRFLAKSGQATAMVAVAEMYDPVLFGKVPSPLPQPNAKIAREWYQRGAELNNEAGIKGLRTLEAWSENQ